MKYFFYFVFVTHITTVLSTNIPGLGLPGSTGSTDSNSDFLKTMVCDSGSKGADDGAWMTCITACTEGSTVQTACLQTKAANVLLTNHSYLLQGDIKACELKAKGCKLECHVKSMYTSKLNTGPVDLYTCINAFPACTKTSIQGCGKPKRLVGCDTCGDSTTDCTEELTFGCSISGSGAPYFIPMSTVPEKDAASVSASCKYANLEEVKSCVLGAPVCQFIVSMDSFIPTGMTGFMPKNQKTTSKFWWCPSYECGGRWP